MRKLLALFCVCSVALGSFDNRYLPVYPRIYLRTPQKPSSMVCAPLFIRDRKARIPHHQATLQDLYKPLSNTSLTGYNLFDVNDAILRIGQLNSAFPSEYYTTQGSLFFAGEGRIDAEGCQLGAEFRLGDVVAVGFVTSVLHVASSINFSTTAKLKSSLTLPTPNTTLQGREREIYNGFLNTYNVLGLEPAEWSGSGFGDTDLYVRFGTQAAYAYKFRRIDGGVRIGVIVPTNVPRDYNNPASISLGGDGFAGFFIMPEFELEFKHDWSVGLWARVEGRIARSFFGRVPIFNEPINFGAITGEFSVTPGVTGGFSPYIRIIDFVDGLGAMVQYVYVRHAHDRWVPQVSATSQSPNITVVQQMSAWTDSHVGVTILLDLNRTKLGFENMPEFTLEVLAPVDIFSPRNVAKSLKISLATEFSF